jgi:5-methylcytosine-specific restriction endonuclease McrA
MYLSFLLGYIYLWRNATPSVRAIIEKEEALLAFAKESLGEDEHNHSTLNNGPAVKAFLESFPAFKDTFYRIVDRFTPAASTPQSKKRETIPGTVKTDVWHTYIGNDKGEGDCYCCKKKVITMRNFEAGHVISDRDGGQPTVDNLRPICRECNGSMGSQHMENFIQKYYPNN